MNMRMLGRVRTGFTLIELSIVLVIIALVAGGIMVGRDMIHAAEVRATINQVEQYETAVNTFRMKYNGLPGDLSPEHASAFGFFAFTTFTPVNAAYEDGYIGGQYNGESLAFWRHLSDAHLIQGEYGSIGNSAIDAATGDVTGAVSDPSQNFPPAKLGGGNMFISAKLTSNYMNPVDGSRLSKVSNGFWLFSPPTLPSVMPLCITKTVAPLDAYAMDTKMDDGMPHAGSVMAEGDWWTSAWQGYCSVGGTADGYTDNLYNTDPAHGGNYPSCCVTFGW